MSIQEAADYLGVLYPWAYQLVVQRGQIPYETHGTGVRGAPKYLVLRSEVRKYKRRKRPNGRPRGSDGHNKGKRRERGAGNILSMASMIQDFRKKHGHYPDLGDVNGIINPTSS